MSHETDQEKFKHHFVASEYLKNYYAEADLPMVRNYVLETTAGAETMRIMMFLDAVCVPLARAMFGKGQALLLELGGGPTLYQLMNLVTEVSEIHFTDYVGDNLDEVRHWKQKEAPYFDWKGFLQAALMIKKDMPDASQDEVTGLEDELRRKITKIGLCDIFKEDLGVPENEYNIINTHFVAESATSSKEEWKKALIHMYKKLTPGGLLFMSALRGAKGSYKVLEGEFPAVELYEGDMEQGLKEAGFEVIRISSIHTEDTSNNYEGFMFVAAQKK